MYFVPGRYNRLLRQPVHKFSIQKHSFSRPGVKLWNEKPSHITDLAKKTFTLVLRQLLFNVLEKEDDYIKIPMIIKKK